MTTEVPLWKLNSKYKDEEILSFEEIIYGGFYREFNFINKDLEPEENIILYVINLYKVNFDINVTTKDLIERPSIYFPFIYKFKGNIRDRKQCIDSETLIKLFNFPSLDKILYLYDAYSPGELIYLVATNYDYYDFISGDIRYNIYYSNNIDDYIRGINDGLEDEEFTIFTVGRRVSPGTVIPDYVTYVNYYHDINVTFPPNLKGLYLGVNRPDLISDTLAELHLSFSLTEELRLPKSLRVLICKTLKNLVLNEGLEEVTVTGFLEFAPNIKKLNIIPGKDVVIPDKVEYLQVTARINRINVEIKGKLKFLSCSKCVIKGNMDSLLYLVSQKSQIPLCRNLIFANIFETRVNISYSLKYLYCDHIDKKYDISQVQYLQYDSANGGNFSKDLVYLSRGDLNMEEISDPYIVEDHKNAYTKLKKLVLTIPSSDDSLTYYFS